MTGQLTYLTGIRSAMRTTQRIVILSAILGAACHHVSDSTGTIEPPSTPVLPSYGTYVDTNDNGICDANDELFLRFDPTKKAPVIDQAFLETLELPVLRSSLGQDPTVTAGSDEFEVRITLGVLPSLKTREVALGDRDTFNSPTFIDFIDEDGGKTTLDVVPGYTNELVGVTEGATAVACADFNGDGQPDLAIVAGTTVMLALGDSNHKFTTVIAAIDPDGEAGQCIRIADVLRDGTPDLLIGTASGFKLWNVAQVDGSTELQLPDPAFGAEPVNDIAIADFNTDGHVDVATAVDGNDGLWLGDGMGSFSSSAAGTAGVSYAILAVDVDADGDIDLLKSNTDEESSGVLLLLGDGLGGMVFDGTLLSGQNVRQIAFGDLNGDALPELVASMAPDETEGPGVASALSWNGTLFAESSISIAAPKAAPTSLTLQDIDGDSRLDLISADTTGIQLLMNDGTGVFDPSGHDYQLVPQGILCVGDSDRDGDMDLFVPTEAGVQRLSSSLSGTWGLVSFDETTQALGSIETFGLAAGDLNNDGLNDFATANNFGIEIYLASGSGQFADPLLIDLPFARVRDIEFSDFDMDGKLDLVAALQGSAGDGIVGMMLRLGDGTGQFPTDASIEGTSAQASALAVGDIDRDGDLDILLAGMNLEADQLILNNGRDVDGWHGLATPVTLGSITDGGGPENFHTSDVVMVDLNDDGAIDILTAHAPGRAHGIWYGTGTGVFNYTGLPGSVSLDSRSIAVGDINLDGQLDIITGNTQGETFWLQDAGQFPVNNILTQSDTYEVQMVEINGDAFPDLLVANRGVGQQEGLQIWINAGLTDTEGSFGAWRGFGIDGRPNHVLRHGFIESVLATDLDNDGDVDIVTGNTDSETSNRLWLNN
ncbi:MAG: hypothetical protein ACI841_002570 [Planctomycetota bacterium]|jgi:hypothetical protein